MGGRRFRVGVVDLLDVMDIRGDVGRQRRRLQFGRLQFDLVFHGAFFVVQFGTGPRMQRGFGLCSPAILRAVIKTRLINSPDGSSFFKKDVADIKRGSRKKIRVKPEEEPSSNQDLWTPAQPFFFLRLNRKES